MMSAVRELSGAEVLVVDRDVRVQQGMTQLLSAAGLHVTCVPGPLKALEQVGHRFYSVVVVDLDTPEPNAGLVTVEEVRELSPSSMVVVLTPRKSFEDSVAAVRAGAVDVIWKSPQSVAHLKDRILDAAGRSVDKRQVGSVLEEVKATHDSLLRRFMDTERRIVDLEDKLTARGLGEGSPSGSGQLPETLRMLVVDRDPTLTAALKAHRVQGLEIELALSGGQALDRTTSGPVHIALIAHDLPDLPGAMVARSIKTQRPDIVALGFSPPPGGKVEILASRGATPVLDPFDHADQLVARFSDIVDAAHQKLKERRYTQSFRDRHYDFLRRYVELKIKIDRALGS
ncbi:MAG TPA: response regulator [Kofleriaceae bacterium]|nr:response regulator [Kofleriaceae bacterium]